MADINKVLNVKFMNGDNIIAEVIMTDSTKLVYYIRNIIQVAMTEDGMMFKHYFPFSKYDKIFPIRIDNILLADVLDGEMELMYYTSVLQMKIDEMKSKTNKKMTGNSKEDYHLIFDSVTEIRRLSEEYVEKYGVEPPNLSDVEEQLEKHKPIFH